MITTSTDLARKFHEPTMTIEEEVAYLIQGSKDVVHAAERVAECVRGKLKELGEDIKSSTWVVKDDYYRSSLDEEIDDAIKRFTQ